MKSEAELRCEAATRGTAGHFFIDAIQPRWDLTDAVYERLGRVSATLASFTRSSKKHQPALLADTGLYFSMRSVIDPGIKRQALAPAFRQLSSLMTPRMRNAGSFDRVARMHRPFKVVRAPRRLEPPHTW